MAALPIFDACALFGPWPQHHDLTVESLLGTLNGSNISRALVLSTIGIYNDYQAGNAATLEVCRAHPDKLVPVATLDPRAYPSCLQEAESCAKAGFKLIRFFPSSQNWPLRLAPFRELLHKCDSLHVTVAVEVSNPGDATELADAVAFTQAPLLLSGVSSENLGEAIAVLRSSPKFHLETTHLLAPGALEAVVAGVSNGHERLVFSSYSPLRYLSSALNVVGASAMTGEQKAAVIGSNLARLLK